MPLSSPAERSVYIRFFFLGTPPPSVFCLGGWGVRAAGRVGAFLGRVQIRRAVTLYGTKAICIGGVGGAPAHPFRPGWEKPQ